MRQVLFVLFMIIVTGFTIVMIATHQENIAIEPAEQSASVIEGINATSGDFNETGTLVFYPNNVGPVPYLFYQDQNGHTVAKELTFPALTPTNFSSWTGARISVTGHLEYEHVVVNSIRYLSAP